MGTKGYAQGVGINSTGTAPHVSAMTHVDVGGSTTKGFLVTGLGGISSSVVPDLGTGGRLMFYPGKGAFRAGYVSSSQWNNVNVGENSAALGFNNIAKGISSTAMGSNTSAEGIASLSTGYLTVASGNYSTAMGTNVNTLGHKGAFTIGDSDPNNDGATLSGSPDQFVARFWNGYYLMTSGNISRFGVWIGHNGNSWVSICDKNRKENFEPLNGEEVLQKISKIKFSSWNYKQQDPKIYRHYGITAQDFYNAFGKDKYGTIGNDTTVNPVDMIGIDMAAIQALEKRTADLKLENEKLKNENAIINKKLDEVTELKKEVQILKNLLHL